MSTQTHSTPQPLKCPAVSPAIIRTIEHSAWTECHATCPASAVANGCSLILCPLLHGDHADSFNIHAFGDHQYLTGLHNQLQAGDAHATETSLLQERGAPGGMHLTTISKIGSTPLLGKNGRVLGSFFEDSDAKYCVLGGIGPTDTKAPRGEQTTEVLDTIQRTLTDAGMHFRDVVRTWFYNDDILAWYPEFNQARTAFFQEHGITRMPASTGIGVANFSGAALVTNAIAVQPKTGAVTVRRVKSPLQHEASAYGSSFSRAMEIADRKGRVLYISGTASILPNGETTHLGDVAGQIEKTMEVVKAILEHNKMNFTDTTRAIAYFRHQEHIPLWNQYCRNHRMPLLPVILTRCDVCRDNLLFEIELDAAKKISSVSNGA